ncbi:MAG TPA: GntR family transcriptional regulator [Candidatus Limnocylindrales bacterium]|nr:GntR family transcriptional regulator [Candidatus Limnocylindrales bacterium]
MSIAGPLDKDLPVPLYHQLQEVLKAEIETGAYQAEEQLPNETKLAERFGVSKITVRQALHGLSEMGYIRREHGRGTFVARRKFNEGPRELTSFTEEMRRHSVTAGAQIVAQSEEDASPQVAHALQLGAGARVYVLKRIRLADGEPVSVQTAHIPAEFVPGMQLEPSASLYDVLQRQYHLFAARAKERYFAALADADASEVLQIAVGSPVFAVERITLLPNDKPFEFVQSIVRGDRYSIVLDLVKHGAEKRVLALS